jgi:hypothetical protein
MENSMNHKNYGRLFVMGMLSFVLMYVLMYAMVDVWSNVLTNFNQFYMAGLMASSMIILELVLMKSMYENIKWNSLIIVASIILLAIFWLGVRQQKVIGDEQFLKSMIPHHGAAILMCKKAPIEDLEIKELCENIISSQQAEIDFMKTKLNSIK